MQTQLLDYPLPDDRIATMPADPRDSARLMVVHRDAGRFEHRRARDLAGGDLLRRGDLMVFNQTRVLPARFEGRRSATGGRVTGLYLESETDRHEIRWQVMLESGGRLREGETIVLQSACGDGIEQTAHLELIMRLGEGRWQAALHSTHDTLEVLHRIGRPPLPPYIRSARRARGEDEHQPGDAERYNTTFASESGSVAAPTAALHFTPQLLDAIEALGVCRAMLTLHIGVGTFAPIRTATLGEHRMHEEWLNVPATTLDALQRTRNEGGRIIVVGTTCVRALESLPEPLPDRDYQALTNLFIAPPAPPQESGQPPFRFRFTDTLMTNFHLPRSTLLALVAALPGVGIEQLKRWYQIAIEADYRFYSYGDAMWLA